VKFHRRKIVFAAFAIAGLAGQLEVQLRLAQMDQRLARVRALEVLLAKP
jgi:hypothetical protein